MLDCIVLRFNQVNLSQSPAVELGSVLLEFLSSKMLHLQLIVLCFELIIIVSLQLQLFNSAVKMPIYYIFFNTIPQSLIFVCNRI